MTKITVHGPPGAGNRLVGRMLQAAPHGWDVTVMHLPGKWFDADAYVFTDRDPFFLTKSMLKEGMVHTEDQAIDWILDARNQIDAWMVERGDKARWSMVDYEELVRAGVGPIIDQIAEDLNVMPWVYDGEEIVDGDLKYLEDSVG